MRFARQETAISSKKQQAKEGNTPLNPLLIEGKSGRAEKQNKCRNSLIFLISESS